MKSGASKFIKRLQEKSVLWMGILNLTQDSFSDGGDFYCIEAALNRVSEYLDYGVDIIDFGACSTRSGSESPPWQDELVRLKPVLEKIRSKCLEKNVLISLDSFHPQVAKSLAEENLIDIINDVMACRVFVNSDVKKICMFDVAKDFNLGLVIMHMKGQPKTMQHSPHYENCLKEVKEFFIERLEKAQQYDLKGL